MATKSGKPRKQRKSRYDAALHERRHFMSVHLSKELRAKLGTKKRSIPVVKGDRVKVMRGDKKGHTGKVLEVDLGHSTVHVEGLVLPRAKGTELPIPVQPSNLLLIDGDFSKKGRKEVVERNKKK
jgi:large subunit ribosomal protein L24